MLLVTEKETRVREGMKIMGLHSSGSSIIMILLPQRSEIRSIIKIELRVFANAVWWVSWFITYSILTVVPATVITILGFVADVFQYSNGFLIWLTLWLYSQTIIALSFVMVTVFNQVFSYYPQMVFRRVVISFSTA